MRVRPDLHYKEILSGQCTIESRLHEHMAAHLNAEIASQLFMNSAENAIEWLRATFLFVRVKKNPSLYKLPKGRVGNVHSSKNEPSSLVLLSLAASPMHMDGQYPLHRGTMG